MAKDPAVLFYTGDFLAGTYTMTMEQKGKYITLLCLQHQQGHLSEKHMLSICSTHDNDIWCKFKQDDNGNYYNQRMEEEALKRCKYTESRRSNASKKDSICETYAEHMQEHMDDHMGNGNEDINNTITNTDINTFFETIWSIYPRKEGKGSVSKAQKQKLYKIGVEEMTRAVERYVAKIKEEGIEKKYIKQGSTFFNSGYVDYLDVNYEQDTPKPTKPRKSHIEIIDGQEHTVWEE